MNDDWNQNGKVFEWTIRRVIELASTIVAEWYFVCNYDGKTEGFE